jgi:hypothetical protein
VAGIVIVAVIEPLIVAVNVNPPVAAIEMVRGERTPVFWASSSRRDSSPSPRDAARDHAHGGVPVHVHGHDHGFGHDHDQGHGHGYGS